MISGLPMREKLGSELLIGQESLKGFLHSPLKIFVGIELRPPFPYRWRKDLFHPGG
jgi:hypothetical protein